MALEAERSPTRPFARSRGAGMVLRRVGRIPASLYIFVFVATHAAKLIFLLCFRCAHTMIHHAELPMLKSRETPQSKPCWGLESSKESETREDEEEGEYISREMRR